MKTATSKEIDEEFQKAWSNLYIPTAKLAETLNVSRTTLRTLVARYQVSYPERDKKRFDLIVSMYQRGMNHETIASLTGGSPSYYKKLYGSVFSESQQTLKKKTRTIDKLPEVVNNKVHIRTRKNSEKQSPEELIVVEKQHWFPNF